jgi:hypothetical protein
MIEETKNQKDSRTSLASVFLRDLKKSGQQDSTKSILRKTKDAVKALVRKREAAKSVALKALK